MADSAWADNLPLAVPSDVRERLSTPEAMLQATAAPDTPIGVAVAGNVFTAGIPHDLTDWTAVQFASTGTVPAPLALNTTYYARATTATTFEVALVIGGASVVLTDAGTGQVTVRNWALNDVLEAKGSLADSYLYDELLTIVMDRIHGLPNGLWYGYFPQNDFGIVQGSSPMERAILVLNNLENATKLKDAAVDFRLWLLAQDGAWRNQIIDTAATQERVSASIEDRMLRRACATLKKRARLLSISTAKGAKGLFDFDAVTDSVRISII